MKVLFMRFLLVAFIIIFQSTFSQNSVYCKLELKVLNASDSLPVPYASVYIINNKKGLYADEKGRINIDLSTDKPYQIHVSSVGFIANETELKIPNSTSFKTTIYLSEDSNTLDSVEITTKSQQKTIETSGFSAESINLKAQESRSIQLNQIIDNLPGVTVRQEGGLGSAVQYSINGLSGNAIKIFIDGTPLEYYGESYSLRSIPTNTIERIDVYKGVVPAELGGDILGGAINIITKKLNNKSLDLSYQTGSFNTHQASLIGNHSGKNGLTVNGQLFYNYSDNNYKVWGEDVFIVEGITPVPVRAKRFHDAYENYGTKVDLGATKVKWADEFLTSILYTDTYKEVQHGATMKKPYGERYYTESNFSPSVNYSKSEFITSDLNFKAFLSYSDVNRHLLDTTRNRYNWLGEKTVHPAADQGLKFSRGEGGNPRDSYTHEKAWVSRANSTYSINAKNKINLNILYTNFKRQNYNKEALIGEDTRNNRSSMVKIISGLSYANLSLADKLKTNLFIKQYIYNTSSIEYEISGGQYYPVEHETKDTNYGFGAAFNYELDKPYMFQLSAERTVRLPSSNELFGNASQNVNTAYTLKPELSNNLNLGIRSKTINFGKNQFNFNTNLFFRDIKNLIQRSSQVIGGIDTFTFKNFGKVLSKGIDFRVQYVYDNKLNYEFSTSYNDTRYKSKRDINGRVNMYYNSRMKNEPFYQFNSTMSYHISNLGKIPGDFDLIWNARYVHWYYRHFENIGKDNKDIIPTQFVNDIGILYTFEKSKNTISLDVKNIANRQVFDNFAIQLPGRSVNLKINLNIF